MGKGKPFSIPVTAQKNTCGSICFDIKKRVLFFILPGAFCYYPHHGFAFFAEKGIPMGHIELCFSCGNAESSPPGLPENEWNWKEFSALLEELEVPILGESPYYTELYKKK
jgi:hypothetical protein